MIDLDRTSDRVAAGAILDKLAADMNAEWNGRPGPPMAYFDLKDGRHAVYVVYTANGFREQGENYGPLAPTAVDAAKGMAHTVATMLAGSIGTLYWRRPTTIDYESPVGFDESQKMGVDMSPGGWRVSMRLIIIDGEWETEPADLHTTPEDYPGWAEMVAKYLEGVPK